MTNNSNSNKKTSVSKDKKDDRDLSDSKKNSKKPSTIPATTVDIKVKNDDKDLSDSKKGDSFSIPSFKLDELNVEKKDDKEKEQLTYFEKQVLKELKGIKKGSKNILKAIKKFEA